MKQIKAKLLSDVVASKSLVKIHTSEKLGCTRRTLDRWLELGAVVIEGQVFIPTGRKL